MASARIKPAGLGQAVTRTLIDTLTADLAENCANVLKTVREDKPYDYLRIVVSLLPKELSATGSNLEEMTDEELGDILNAVRSLIAARSAAPAGEGDAASRAGSAPQHRSGILRLAAPADQDQGGID